MPFDLMDDLVIGAWKENRSLPPTRLRVIDQSSRRLLKGKQVPTEKKIYSIFETHTDLIKRGKVQ